MKPPNDANPESWHRFFGAGANNAAWTFAELPASEVDRRTLLDAAHAAAWHWQQVGTELNRMRALMLLAQAHAQAGLGQNALGFADEMRPYFLVAPGTPDWELAFTMSCTPMPHGPQEPESSTRNRMQGPSRRWRPSSTTRTARSSNVSSGICLLPDR